MMSAMDPKLSRRLERLTGEDPACCVAELGAQVDRLRAGASYDTALERAKALGNDARLTAAFLLDERGEMCACEIQAGLALTHATVSHHMSQLVDAGLVGGTKRGRWVYYRLTDAGRRLLEEVGR